MAWSQVRMAPIKFADELFFNINSKNNNVLIIKTETLWNVLLELI